MVPCFSRALQIGAPAVTEIGREGDGVVDAIAAQFDSFNVEGGAKGIKPFVGFVIAIGEPPIPSEIDADVNIARNLTGICEVAADPQDG